MNADQVSNSISWPFVISTMVLAAFFFFPQARILITYDQLAYLSALYYVCFIVKSVSFTNVINMMKYTIPFCLLMFVSRGFDFKYGFVLNLMTLWNLLIPSVICTGIIIRNRRRELVILTWASIAMIVTTCVVTLAEMSLTANVMRELTAGTTDEVYAADLRQKGVGGFGVAYAMGAFAVGLFVLLKKIPKNKKIWWIILALMLFIVYFITQAQFTTLLLLTLVGVASYYYLTATTFRQKIAVVGYTIALIFLLPYLVQLLIVMYSDSTIGVRLDRMYESLWGDGEMSEVSGNRSLQQLDAIMLFFKSPIWGNNIVNPVNAYIYLACHSTLFAVAAATGLIGIWSYIKSFKTAFDYQLDVIINTSLKNSYYPIILYYLLFAIFNPIDGFPEAPWVIFVVIPSLYKLYGTQKKVTYGNLEKTN